MSPLNNEQKQLLFDYSIGLTSEEEATEAEALISSNEEAAEIHSKLKAALAPLDSLKSEPCPDHLVEGTIWRVNNLADSSQLQLQQLLAAEQTRAVTTKGTFWRNFGEMIAVAAVILLFTGVLIPPLSFARQKYWQQRCQKQMGSIFQGVTRYSSDYENRLPAVATKPGTRWCRVGHKGSSTRSLWLLVKKGYVSNPADFVCPGRRQGRALQFDTSRVQMYNDFPHNRYVTYSPTIPYAKSKKRYLLTREPLMSDRNPMFEGLFHDCSCQGDCTCEIKLQLNDKLLMINSRNHRGRGQNILFGNGGVVFIRVRRIGISEDDIFSLQEMYRGFEVKGCEVPSCETDVLLAP